MKEKNLKLIMELIFIFILPLIILLPCVSIKKDIVYDNNGNFEITSNKLEYTNPFIYSNSNLTRLNSSISIEDLSSYNIYFNPNLQVESSVESGNRLCYLEFSGRHDSYTLLIQEDYGDNDKLALIDAYSETVYASFDLIEIITIDNTIYYNYGVIDFNYYLEYYTDGYNEILNIDGLFLYNHNFTLLGQIKLLFTDFLDFNDSSLLDLFISYNFLWLMFFVSWHLLYAFLDFIVHLMKIRKRE